MMTLFLSESESSRFGMRVFRSEGEVFHPERLQKKLFDLDADLLILRLPSQPGVSGSENMAVEVLGFPYIHAGNLVTYEKELDGNPPRTHSGRVTFEKVRHDHFPQLNTLIADVFKWYPNHYTQDPYLDDKVIVSGYQEWAWKIYTENHGASSYIAFIEGVPAGFAICSTDSNEGICTIQLNGVHPQFQRKGIYTDLLRLILHDSYQDGLRQIRVSTQTGNTAIQKIWTGEGLHLSAQYSTYHILPFLSFSTKEKLKIPINFGKMDKKQDQPERLNSNIVVEEMAKSIMPFAEECLKNAVWEKCIEINPVSSSGSYELSVSFIVARRGHHHFMVQILQDQAGKKYLIKYVDFQYQKN